MNKIYNQLDIDKVKEARFFRVYGNSFVYDILCGILTAGLVYLVVFLF